MEGEQAPQLTENNEEEEIHPDEYAHKIISKIFGLQRGFEFELSEVKHKYKMLQMHLEESESLKFDIEILTEEKVMLD